MYFLNSGNLDSRPYFSNFNRHKNQHFHKAPGRCCCCCWDLNHILSFNKPASKETIRLQYGSCCSGGDSGRGRLGNSEVEVLPAVVSLGLESTIYVWSWQISLKPQAIIKYKWRALNEGAEWNLKLAYELLITALEHDFLSFISSFE